MVSPQNINLEEDAIRFWLYKSEIQLVRFGWVYIASKNEPVFIWISYETVRYALANVELNS